MKVIYRNWTLVVIEYFPLSIENILNKYPTRLDLDTWTGVKATRLFAFHSSSVLFFNTEKQLQINTTEQLSIGIHRKVVRNINQRKMCESTLWRTIITFPFRKKYPQTEKCLKTKRQDMTNEVNTSLRCANLNNRRGNGQKAEYFIQCIQVTGFFLQSKNTFHFPNK